MKPDKTSLPQSFSQPVANSLLLGSVAASCFYGLLLLGPLDYPLLQRYCANHPVAIACVTLFFAGLVTLIRKWIVVLHQRRVNAKAASALRGLAVEGCEVPLDDRPAWLAAHWETMSTAVRSSWLGQRLAHLLELQISRGRRQQIEADMQVMAEAESDRQHESYSLLRIINWAMPMLGFLGTVLGISQTLGQLDTRLLASEQQDAMNQLTAGLYVAFDTTAIALILTVVLMFLQFAISRLETTSLASIDAVANREIIAFLGSDPHNAQSTLLAPVREMTAQLVEQVNNVTERQAQIWSDSIAESQSQWAKWTERAATAIEESITRDLTSGLSQVLSQHTSSLQQLQDDADKKTDARWQQWQTTLSDQARTLQSQHKELARHGASVESLIQSVSGLVDSISDLRKLEETVLDNSAWLKNVGRIEESTLTLAEAVQMLGTNLERSGIIRGVPRRPRLKSAENTNGLPLGNADHSTADDALPTEARSTDPTSRDKPTDEKPPELGDGDARRAA